MAFARCAASSALDLERWPKVIADGWRTTCRSCVATQQRGPPIGMSLAANPIHSRQREAIEPHRLHERIIVNELKQAIPVRSDGAEVHPVGCAQIRIGLNGVSGARDARAGNL